MEGSGVLAGRYIESVTVELLHSIWPDFIPLAD